jgi:hypothetical protein
MVTGSIEVKELSAVPVVVVRGRVPPAGIHDFLSGSHTDVLRVLGEQRRSPAGPPFARFTAVEDGFEVEAGFPAAAALDPAGRADALGEWLAAHGYEPTGTAWESYLDEPDVPDPRTLVTFPCARRT